MTAIRFGRFICCGVVTALLAATVAAQAGGVDPTFNAAPMNPLPNDTNFQQIIQPDGKILVYNAPTMFVGGQLRSGMFRLNQDGSLDPTFSYNNEGAVGIHNVMVAPDGKIILAGSTSPNHAKMVRLNPDGSLDNSFTVFIQAVGPPEFTGNWLVVQAIQADGKVIATHGSWGNIMGTWYSYSMRRYNLDASVDTSFNSPPLTGGHLMTTSALMEQLPDGRIYLATTSRSHIGGGLSITRLLANGTQDSSFAPFSASIPPSGFLSIEDISVASDGGLLATGVFQQTAVGFPPRDQVRRFLPDGSLAPGFAAPLVFSASAIQQLSNGKIFYSASGGTTITRPLVRLDSNGSLDNTFVLDPAIASIKNTWRVDSMDRPIFLAQTSSGPRLVRLLETGSIDPTFTPALGAVGSIDVMAVQPDGKVLLGGVFTSMNGVARNRFARVNADGSLDTSFDPGSGFNSTPRQLLGLPDGKVLAVGSFSTYNGASVGRLVRLNSDGSLDTGFLGSITSGTALSLARQPDGKILVGGTFGSANGVARTGLARLEADGSLDATFNPVLGSPTINRIVVEPGGKIVIGGLFTGVNGVDRNNLARLEANGTTDAGFQANGLSVTEGLWRQPDGRYLVNNGALPVLSRRNNDGSPDSSFTAPPMLFGSETGFIRTVVVQPDGSMVVGGRFNAIGGAIRWHLTRLKSNGAHDPTFLSTGANLEVFGAERYSDTKVMVVGSFSTIDDVARLGVARVDVPALQRKARFDFEGDGRADISVYRPSTGKWYQLFSSGIPYAEPTFGVLGDIAVPADFDGDGKTDLSIYRPSTGDWWYLTSSTNQLRAAHLGGEPGDIPLPADINGDGTDDFVIFRPSNNTWYRITTTGTPDTKVFGLAGDRPLIGDFDGDGKADQAIFRPSSGDWWYSASSAGGTFRATHWGQNGDVPAPADYDGDGRTDHAIYRPSDGGWYIFRSSDLGYTILPFGISEDRPVPADYDGDGKADIAVFRPSTGAWYLLRSTSGFAGYHWGLASDVAIPNAFVHP